MSVELGHKQIAAMFTLMKLAREVSNPELEEVVGFRLTGEDRRKLNKQGLVSSREERRTLYHELTDDGWAWCAKEFSAKEPPGPRPRSVLGVALYVVLNGLNDYMLRENLRPADVFASTGEHGEEDLEQKIRLAYRKLAASPQAWVGLADLRPLLGDVPTDEVDAALKEMSRSGQAHLVPEPNRKTLDAADHAAAVRIGGEDNHLISIEAS
ncbi:hypothetical protein KIPE111705_25795 [Kibdelosporangium persicum]|uniref:DUF4194 domain-containing protein n=1 Tax=Kibdelosporangium persicum TaxID=2698649 RepID=A0ABX2FGT0_9PSEU|nr:hypothetical protein [Kibdelosporangium persicum]NRN70598.1 hypothetical protein [Kibdelosporangium persicum]